MKFKLIEKRKVDLPKEETTKELNKYKDKNNIFVSFTNIEKIGINPLSKFNTPLGIYAYPLWLYPDAFSVGSRTFPYASERENLQILQANIDTNIIYHLKEYSSKDYDDDIERLERYFKYLNNIDYHKIITIIDKIGISYEYDFNDSVLNNIFKIGNTTSRENIIFGKMWNITRLLSKIITNLNYKASDMTKIVIWNFILRKVLGYDGFVDEGLGIIHPSEPMQAIFTSIKAFTHLKTIKNKEINHKNNIQLLMMNNKKEELLNYIKKYDISLDLPLKLARDDNYPDYIKLFSKEINQDLYKKLKKENLEPPHKDIDEKIIYFEISSNKRKLVIFYENDWSKTIIYYGDGKINYENTYKNGKLEGKQYYWDESKNKWQEFNYKDGNKIDN